MAELPEEFTIPSGTYVTNIIDYTYDSDADEDFDIDNESDDDISDDSDNLFLTDDEFSTNEESLEINTSDSEMQMEDETGITASDGTRWLTKTCMEHADDIPEFDPRLKDFCNDKKSISGTHFPLLSLIILKTRFLYVCMYIH